MVLGGTPPAMARTVMLLVILIPILQDGMRQHTAITITWITQDLVMLVGEAVGALPLHTPQLQDRRGLDLQPLQLPDP